MFEVLLECLPMSLGVALSPVPIAATLMLMLTPGARANASALLAGWVAGISSVAVVVLLLPGLETSRGAPTLASGYVRLAVGLALLVLAARQWATRPRADDEPATPALLERLDQLDVRRSALTGFVLSAANPKNLLLVAGGANVIDTSMLPRFQQLAAIAAFTLVASSTIAIPVAGHAIFGSAAERLFASWKTWLVRNAPIVIAALLAVFGVLLAVGGGRIVLAQSGGI